MLKLPMLTLWLDSFATHPFSGENDLRATYCAFVICHLLDAWEAIDVPKSLTFIEQCRVSLRVSNVMARHQTCPDHIL